MIFHIEDELNGTTYKFYVEGEYIEPQEARDDCPSVAEDFEVKTVSIIGVSKPDGSFTLNEPIEITDLIFGLNPEYFTEKLPEFILANIKGIG